MSAVNAAPLKIVLGSYGHTEAIKSGRIGIEGVNAEFVEVKPVIAAFRRMVREVAYDVCELAPTTYLIARERGAPFIALPIFLMRRFHHHGIVCRPGSSINTPKDLEGKKVGVRAYSVTTGVWTRGLLANEYGVDASEVTWVVDDEEHVADLVLPPNVVKAGKDRSLQQMLEAGEIDAGFLGAAGVGRAGPPGAGWDHSKEARVADLYDLLPDASQLEAEWYGRTGVYPVHGLVVVRETVLRDHPHLAESLRAAFETAKTGYLHDIFAQRRNEPDDIRYRKLAELVGDPLPYGLEGNRATLETLITYARQQGLIRETPRIEDLFAAS